VSIAIAVGRGAGRKWTPAARAAVSSTASSPMCRMRPASTPSSSIARERPSGAGLAAAWTTTPKYPLRPASARSLRRLRSQFATTPSSSPSASSRSSECRTPSRTSHHADVDGSELCLVEVGSDGIEEHACAILLKPCKAFLVVPLARMRPVVRNLVVEPGKDDVVWPGCSSLGQSLGQRRDGVRERDERSIGIERDGVELGRVHATHCHNAHWTTAMPRKNALHATTAACARGRPSVSAARARKKGKITRPNRGSESSGQRELG
jgi:hypothetical protein